MSDFSRSLILSLLLVSPAQAQAQPQRTTPPNTRPFMGGFGGVSENQFLRSNVSLAAGQLVAELKVVRQEVTKIPAQLQQRFTLTRLATDAVRHAEELQRLAQAGASREQLIAADQRVDQTVDALLAQLQRTIQPSPALSEAITRASYADQQLHAILAADGPGQGGGLRRLARLAESVVEAGELLREMANTSGGDRNLDRQLSSFTNRVERLQLTLEDGGPLNQAINDYKSATTRWAALTPQLNAFTSTRPAIRLQVARVDRLFQLLGQRLQATAGGPDILPPVPPTGPGFIDHGCLAIAAGQGGGPRVRIFADSSGGPAFDFFAYDPNFRGGVRLAVADINADGVPDLVTAPGPGMPPVVRVFDGRTMQLASEFLAYDQSWTGGVSIAACDATRNSPAYIVTGTDIGGGPHVKLFDLSAGREVAGFFAYPESYRGGVRVALGDVNGDGIPDIITAPGPQFEPRIRVFNGTNRQPMNEFLAFERGWTGGVTLAAADTRRDGRCEIVVGSEAGGPARVRVFDPARGRQLYELTPFPPTFRGGVRVACYDFNGDGVLDVACAPGPDPRTDCQPVRVFNGKNRVPLGQLQAFEPSFQGGMFVSSR